MFVPKNLLPFKDLFQGEQVLWEQQSCSHHYENKKFSGFWLQLEKF